MAQNGPQGINTHTDKQYDKWVFHSLNNPACVFNPARLSGGTGAQGTSSTPAFSNHHHPSQGHHHPHHRQQQYGGSGGPYHPSAAAAAAPVKIEQYNHNHRQYDEDCDGGGCGGPYLPSAAACCGTPTQSRGASVRGSWSVYRPPATGAGAAAEATEEGEGGGATTVTNGLLPRIKLRKVSLICLLVGRQGQPVTFLGMV